MKIFDLRCPNCSAKLVRKTDILLVCEACQSEFLIDVEKRDHYIINHYYEESPRSVVTPPVTQTTNRSPLAAIFGALFLFAGLITAVLFLFSDETPSSRNQQSTTLPSRQRPVSEGSKLLVEGVFNKPFADVTTEELASIAYLEVFARLPDTGWDFRYGLTECKDPDQNYDYQELAINHKVPLEVLDFTSFKGLNYLDFNQSFDIGGRYDPLSYAEVKNLRYYGHILNQRVENMLDSLAENSQLAYLKTEVSNTQDMSDLASMSQLKGLYLTNAPLRASLDELAAFNHLEELAFVSSGNSNLDWLASLTNIKALTINLADEVTDFSVLYGMPNLEKLAIDKAEFLKELDFVKNMPNLNELAISRSSVQSIS